MNLIIKYYWIDKQRDQVLRTLKSLRSLVEKGSIWFLDVDNSPTKERHEIGCRLIEGLINRVEEMRKITEEY